MRFISRRVIVVAVLCVAAFGQQQVNLDTGVKGSRWPAFGTDSGASNAYAVTTIAPLGPILRTGSTILFFAANANTGASTLAVDGGAAIAIKKNVSTALASGDIPANGVVLVAYDGTNFQCMTCSSGGGSSFYQTVQANGSSMAQEVKLNLKSGTNTTVSCADNSGAGSTDCTVNATGAGGGLGLFNQIMSTTPTSASTGFTTWMNQGATATVTDTAVGVSIYDGTACGATCWRVRSKAVPSTPYSAIALLQFNIMGGFDAVMMGWTDGTKLQGFLIFYNNPPLDYNVANYNSVTSFNGSVFGNSAWNGNYGATAGAVWLKLSDNGTNITFYFSPDGVTWRNFYSVAKASGFLGASGYTNLFYAVEPVSFGSGVTLLSYKETSP